MCENSYNNDKQVKYIFPPFTLIIKTLNYVNLCLFLSGNDVINEKFTSVL